MAPNHGHYFHFVPAPPDRLILEISGALGDYIAEELTARTVEALANQPGTRGVLVDLRSLRDCTVMARVGLSTLQKLLLRRQIRTAWLVATPRMHGLATLVAHNANDPGAGVFLTLAQAETWFGGTTGRLEGFMANARRKS